MSLHQLLLHLWTYFNDSNVHAVTHEMGVPDVKLRVNLIQLNYILPFVRLQYLLLARSPIYVRKARRLLYTFLAFSLATLELVNQNLVALCLLTGGCTRQQGDFICEELLKL